MQSAASWRQAFICMKKSYSKTLSMFTIWKKRKWKSAFPVFCFSHNNEMWQVLRGIHCKSDACGGKASNEQSKHEVIVGMITRAWPLKPSVPPSIRGIMVPRPAAIMNVFLITKRIVWGTIWKITWNTSSWQNVQFPRLQENGPFLSGNWIHLTFIGSLFCFEADTTKKTSWRIHVTNYCSWFRNPKQTTLGCKQKPW